MLSVNVWYVFKILMELYLVCNIVERVHVFNFRASENDISFELVAAFTRSILAKIRIFDISLFFMLNDFNTASKSKKHSGDSFLLRFQIDPRNKSFCFKT